MSSPSSSKDSYATAAGDHQGNGNSKQQADESSTTSANKIASNKSSAPKVSSDGSFDVVKYEYLTKFPGGRFLWLKTSSDNYECGLDVLTQSIQAQYGNLDNTFPTTSIQELRGIAALTELKMKQNRNFVDEDLEKILQHWGRMHKRSFCLGVVAQSSKDVCDVGTPFLTSLNEYEGSDTLIVWLHNDNSQLRSDDKNLLNHWSGMGPPRQTRSSSLRSTTRSNLRSLKMMAVNRLIALIEVPESTDPVRSPRKSSKKKTADKQPTPITMKT